MQELLEFVAKKILNHPDDVVVMEENDERGLRVTLIVHPEDVGLAIGKAGKTANALRELLKVKVTGSGNRVMLDIKSKDD
jgi:predicted RNA-binding protein YlqC (UPF0109 family)